MMWFQVLLKEYTHMPGETDKDYWLRLLYRGDGDTIDSYKARVLQLKSLFSILDWDNIEWDDNNNIYVYRINKVGDHLLYSEKNQQFEKENLRLDCSNSRLPHKFVSVYQLSLIQSGRV